MDYKSQLAKEKLIDKIKSENRAPTEMEKQALEYFGKEGQWYDSLQPSEKSKYRKLPDISDIDALHLMNEPKDLSSVSPDPINRTPISELGDPELRKSIEKRMDTPNYKKSIPDKDIASKIAKSSATEFPKSSGGLKSRMASKFELEALKKLAGKMGSGLGRKAAGLAIGGPLALASELADASEIGLSERDEIIESTKYSPEEKKALLRGLDMKKKLSEESGDVSRDPAVLKAREIGERLKNEYYESMPEEERIKTREDKKREAAKDARRRLAEEMMKRQILPKVRE